MENLGIFILHALQIALSLCRKVTMNGSTLMEAKPGSDGSHKELLELLIFIFDIFPKPARTFVRRALLKYNNHRPI